MTADVTKCRYCGVDIGIFNTPNGAEWLHMDRRGSYKVCEKPTVATPPETIGEWASRMFKPQR